MLELKTEDPLRAEKRNEQQFENGGLPRNQHLYGGAEEQPSDEGKEIFLDNNMFLEKLSVEKENFHFIFALCRRLSRKSADWEWELIWVKEQSCCHTFNSDHFER